MSNKRETFNIVLSDSEKETGFSDSFSDLFIDSFILSSSVEVVKTLRIGFPEKMERDGLFVDILLFKVRLRELRTKIEIKNEIRTYK